MNASRWLAMMDAPAASTAAAASSGSTLQGLSIAVQNLKTIVRRSVGTRRQHPPACTKAAPWSCDALRTSRHVLTAFALCAHCAHTCRRCSRCRVVCRCCSSWRLLQRRGRKGQAGWRQRWRENQTQAAAAAAQAVWRRGTAFGCSTSQHRCWAAARQAGEPAADPPLLVSHGWQPLRELLQFGMRLLHHIIQHIAERHQLQAAEGLLLPGHCSRCTAARHGF